MGLDWIPLGKPKPEDKEKFEDLFLLLTDQKKQERKGSWLSRAIGLNRPESKEALSKQFLEIPVITPYETLKAPMVGRDQAANIWVKELYEAKKLRKDLLSQPFNEVIAQMKGYFVVDLVQENDGIPVYTSGLPGDGYNPERFWFRGKFLELCDGALGKSVLEEAFVSKLAPELAEFGNKLSEIAKSYARKNSVEHVLGKRRYDWDDESTPEAQAHIVDSAARWCLFWSNHGHGLEANF